MASGNDLNDLDNRTFKFLGPQAFRDRSSPTTAWSRAATTMTATTNITATTATAITTTAITTATICVKLPFNTANRFSDINPLGNDVDFYRFRAKAGDILAIETVPGLQTMDNVSSGCSTRTGTPAGL